MRGQKILNWMIAKIAQIYFALIFLMTQILICYYHSHIFVVPHCQRTVSSLCYDFALHCDEETSTYRHANSK
jgi:hypothetical protein